MFKLVKHVIPSYKCREVTYIVVLAALLVVRTMMSIWLADVNGRVVKAIVNKDLRQFIVRVSSHVTLLLDFCAIFVCSAIVNSELRN